MAFQSQLKRVNFDVEFDITIVTGDWSEQMYKNDNQILS